MQSHRYASFKRFQNRGASSAKSRQLSLFLSMQVPEAMIPAPVPRQALERPHSSSISCGNPKSRSICSQNLCQWSKVTCEKYPIITTPNPASKALFPWADISSTSSKDTTDQKFVIPQDKPILPLTRTCWYQKLLYSSPVNYTGCQHFFSMLDKFGEYRDLWVEVEDLPSPLVEEPLNLLDIGSCFRERGSWRDCLDCGKRWWCCTCLWIQLRLCGDLLV